MLLLKVSVLASIASVCLAVTFPQTIDRLMPVVAHSLPETLLQLMHQPIRRQGYYPLPMTSVSAPPQALTFSSPSAKKEESSSVTKRLAKPPPSLSLKRQFKQLPDKPQLEQITKASVNPYLLQQENQLKSFTKKTAKSLKSTKKEKKDVHSSGHEGYLDVGHHVDSGDSYDEPRHRTIVKSHHGPSEVAYVDQSQSPDFPHSLGGGHVGGGHVIEASSSGYSGPSLSRDVHFSGSPGHHSAPSYGHHEKHHYKPAKYNFKYVVQDKYSGSDYGHQEAREGDDTKGAYYVQLPDGRRQTVNYYVNKGSGYVAKVHYDGKAQYPPPSHYKRNHGAGGVGSLYREGGSELIHHQGGSVGDGSLYHEGGSEVIHHQSGSLGGGSGSLYHEGGSGVIHHQGGSLGGGSGSLYHEGGSGVIHHQGGSLGGGSGSLYHEGGSEVIHHGGVGGSVGGGSLYHGTGDATGSFHHGGGGSLYHDDGSLSLHHGAVGGGLGGGDISFGHSSGGGYHGLDNHIESANFPSGHDVHSSSQYGTGAEEFLSHHGGSGTAYH